MIRNKLSTHFLFCLLLFVLSSCGGGSKATSQSETSREDNVKIKQYMVQGQSLYKTYCIACHQQEGNGLAQLYPPLAQSDYLMEDFQRAACIIKNGLQDEIIVNGTSYNQVMIANAGLSPLEIAEILTYVTNSWGNEAGLIGSVEVSKWLNKCDQQGN